MFKENQFFFQKNDISRLKLLTSLNFSKFTLKPKEYLPEKFLLYKACRIFEDELIKILNIHTDTLKTQLQKSKELQAIYLELGHLNLLAQDYARALSAYQKSYCANKHEFWKDGSGLYGLGVTYLHFRAYRPAIEAFCQLLFCYPYIEVATEVHAQLGIAYKCLENFSQSLKHLLIALDDTKELQLIPKYQIRFHIAQCYDGAGDFKRAIEEYRRLLTDNDNSILQLPFEVLAVVYRQLGWINLRLREKEFKEETRQQKLKEAEQYLIRARDLSPTDSKTHCYLGLCYSEQTIVPASITASNLTASLSNVQQGINSCNSNNLSTSNNLCNSAKSSTVLLNLSNATPPLASSEIQQKQQQTAADKAQDAFVSYRSAIDSDESDANTWCSIGVLYQQQNQPIDALQAFACAVQLDENHSAAWTELGKLYETYRQYNESLHCYKKALAHNPIAPEILRNRINAIEKEFSTSKAANSLTNYLQSSTNRTSGFSRIQILPSLESAWQLGIPAQVRQRLSDFYKQQENRYRKGSPLWTMSELTVHSLLQSFHKHDPVQRQIIEVLKLNKNSLEEAELKLLNQLEEQYNKKISNTNNYFNITGSNCELILPKSQTLSINNNVEKTKYYNNENQKKNFDCWKDPTTSYASSSMSNENYPKSELRVTSTNFNDGLKMKISRTLLSETTSDFPCLSQDDLVDVFGDANNKTETNDPNPLLTNSLELEKNVDVNRKNRNVLSLFKNDDKNLSGIDTSETICDNDSESQIKTISAVQLQEERISSTTNFCINDDLPPAFSLLAPVNVPVTISSAEILEMCKKRQMKSADYKSIFDEVVSPPKPPSQPTKKLSKEQLLLKTPLIVIENAREAFTTELQNFCYNSTIALVHGLTAALKIDLSQFSTKSLIQTASDHEVEVRTQYKMPVDVNVDHLGNSTWTCYSTKSFTTIGRYGQYQAESFRHSLKEETEKLKQTAPISSNSNIVVKHSVANDELLTTSSNYNLAVNQSNNGTSSLSHNGTNFSSSSNIKRRKTTLIINGINNSDNSIDNLENNGCFPLKTIKFGTNVDLSDERKFHTQIKELNKMPAFCRISAACNLLTHIGHTVLGMNTIQLYMKVPGCRTPGHLENNSFASININIGPGECEWFGVPYEYWPVIERMCKERDLDFLKGAWWPLLQDLINAKVPCYRFTQKAGDMVWVGGGCVHWVQSTGWCNNVAWNVGPMTANQLEMALYAHEWNRLNTYRSLVPMQHLAWQLARNVRFSNQKIFNVVKNILIRSFAYCKMVYDFVERKSKSPIKNQSRQKGEATHYCHLCEIEVFNLLFVKEVSGKFRVFCVQCARKNNLDDYVVLQQISFEELSNIFDRFQLHPSKSALVC